MTETMGAVHHETQAFAASDALDLLDWKQRILSLYEDVRGAGNAETAWRRWRTVRDRLYRDHPQSPVPPERRAGFRGSYYDYDPAFRVLANVVDAEPVSRPAPASTGGTFAFTRIGYVHFSLLGADCELELLWNEGYGGGLLAVVGDETSGSETYAGGRYVLDTVKGSDLGRLGGCLVLDFNYAYNPSCAFDARWACPLAPPANVLPLRLEAGERAPAWWPAAT